MAQLGWGAGLLLLAASAPGADQDAATQRQFNELQRQNQALQEQLQKQQKLIENLTEKVSGLQRSDLRDTDQPVGNRAGLPSRGLAGLGLGKVHITGEGGVAFFRSEGKGPSPNSEFRVDEARLFVEAPIWKDTYFFSELNITTREAWGNYFELGELYLDFENLSRFWNHDQQLNLRVGRFDIPFGDEYLTRDAIDNPLISHSLSDIWGIDEGVELYGSIGKLQYTAALQNGGNSAVRDFDADKSIALRIGYDVSKRVHASVSAMRTGALSSSGDGLSELWFGNAYIRALDMATATTFQANLLEGDVQVRWSQGYLKGAGGYLKYNDNGSADVHREVYYYYLEALHRVTPHLYAAARWSQILARDGFPLVGNGSWDEYFMGPSTSLTKDLWRFSLGVGYRFSPNLLLKAEYSFNEGRVAGGQKRTQENMLSAEAAFAF